MKTKLLYCEFDPDGKSSLRFHRFVEGRRNTLCGKKLVPGDKISPKKKGISKRLSPCKRCSERGVVFA